MIVSVNWLKDYVDINVDIDRFCEGMIMSGSEVEIGRASCRERV